MISFTLSCFVNRQAITNIPGVKDILLGMFFLISILKVARVIFVLALKLFAIQTVMLSYTLATNRMII